VLVPRGEQNEKHLFLDKDASICYLKFVAEDKAAGVRKHRCNCAGITKWLVPLTRHYRILYIMVLNAGRLGQTDTDRRRSDVMSGSIRWFHSKGDL
jgi:hypothetical protein